MFNEMVEVKDHIFQEIRTLVGIKPFSGELFYLKDSLGSYLDVDEYYHAMLREILDIKGL